MATTEKANLPPKLVGRLATLFPDSDFLGLAEERGTPSGVTSKPANEGHLKTGQRA